MRKIYCYKCGKYLGEIRDATLLKGIRFDCGACGKPKYDMPPGFEKLFGGIF